KSKTIIIDNYRIHYDTTTLPDPPTVFYRSKNDLEQLIKDWTSTSDLKIDGVRIPLCYWQKLYSRTRPRVWKIIKDQWSKFKLFVGAYKSFSDPESFWAAISLRTKKNKDGTANLSLTAIHQVLIQDKQRKDIEDAEEAKERYNSTEFNDLFAYRKGGKQYVLKKDTEIARRYRRLENRPAYWDEQGQEESETEE